jgi:hypothetical protein
MSSRVLSKTSTSTIQHRTINIHYLPPKLDLDPRLLPMAAVAGEMGLKFLGKKVVKLGAKKLGKVVSKQAVKSVGRPGPRRVVQKVARKVVKEQTKDYAQDQLSKAFHGLFGRDVPRDVAGRGIYRR